MKHTMIGMGFLVSVLTPTLTWALVGVNDVPNPRRQNVWVTDMADMIDPALETRLNALLDAAHQELTIEIAVVTVDDVDAPTPKDFATSLFNHWGIGHRQTNNGLLLLMVRDQRRLEMETGYGLEPVLTDGWLKAMQEGEMVPRFKRGEYGEGIFNGVSLSIDRVRANRDGVIATNDFYDGSSRDGEVPLWPFGLVGGGGIVTAAVARYKHRKDRTCKTCNKKMQMLPEEQDDEHLSAGQLMEENLGSVDWQYYYCDTCGHHKLLRVNRWFSGYQSCRKCGYKTTQVSETVLSPATYSSSGSARVTETCKHCGNRHVYHKTLPRLERSSSSSGGGGGSSFGGGSSGGGGSGSSW